MSEFPKLPRIKQDDENMEKIHCASRRGQTELVRRLIASGIDPAIHNKFGCTALHLACKHGQSGCVRELSSKTDLTATWHGARPLHLAVDSGNQEVVKILIEAAREAGKDMNSILNDSDEYELLEVRGRPKHVTGQTPLHLAITNRNMAMAKLLLSLGAAPNAKDKNGESLLVRCIEFDLEPEFELLINHNDIRVDATDRNGRSALHHALAFGRPAMAKALADKGADGALEDGEKETPFTIAAEMGYPQLLDQIIHDVEPFTIQSAGFHNGVNVLPERINFRPHVTEEAVKNEVFKVLQKKLDSLKDKNASQGKGPHKAGNMSLAPSAPVRRN